MGMATKTISIDMDAYTRLRRARQRPDESFSQVIKRAAWERPGHTCGAFLAAVSSAPALAESELDALDRAQRNDLPPEDPWQKR